MKIELRKIETQRPVNPNAHLFGEPEGEMETVVYSAEVWVDGVEYGIATDCDMGRWIISDYVERDVFSEEMGPLDGCYSASDVPSLAFALAECVEGVSHSDVSVA